MERSELSFQTRQLIEGIASPFAKAAVNAGISKINNMTEEEIVQLRQAQLRRGIPRQCGNSRSQMLLTLAMIHREDELRKARIASHTRGSSVKGNSDIPKYVMYI